MKVHLYQWVKARKAPYIPPRKLVGLTGCSCKPLPQTTVAGFTLLEVMVAVAIVGIALVAFLRLHLLSLDATIRAQDLTTAVLLTQGRLATMGAFPEPGEEEGKFEGPELERFRWTTEVNEHTLEIGSTQPVQLRRVQVTVLWLDGQQQRSYTLETYGTGTPGTGTQ
jgi:general secretion pathway protein I